VYILQQGPTAAGPNMRQWLYMLCQSGALLE